MNISQNPSAFSLIQNLISRTFFDFSARMDQMILLSVVTFEKWRSIFSRCAFSSDEIPDYLQGDGKIVFHRKTIDVLSLQGFFIDVCNYILNAVAFVKVFENCQFGIINMKRYNSCC